MLSRVRRGLTRDRLSVSRSRRTAAVAAIGPLIVLAGVLCALAQVERPQSSTRMGTASGRSRLEDDYLPGHISIPGADGHHG
jgi:hypothetical protein